MKYVALAYLALFILFIVYSVVDGIRDHDPLPEMVAEALALGVFSGGAILWLFDVNALVPPGVWSVLLVLAIAVETAVVVRSRARALRRLTLEYSPEDLAWLTRFADLGVPVLCLPAIVMSLLYVWR